MKDNFLETFKERAQPILDKYNAMRPEHDGTIYIGLKLELTSGALDLVKPLAIELEEMANKLVEELRIEKTNELRHELKLVAASILRQFIAHYSYGKVVNKPPTQDEG